MRSKSFLTNMLILIPVLLAVCSCGGEDSEGGGCTPNMTECADDVSYKVCDDDGNWEDPVACNTDEVCIAGTCQPGGDGDYNGECNAGESICVGDLIKECSASGTWETEHDCPEGESCSGGICTSGSSCQASIQTRCVDDSHMQTCNDAGDGWASEEECKDGEICYSGRCQIVDCEPGVETSCDSSGNIVTCNATGDGWEDPKPCEVDYVCYEGRCIEEGTQVCTPGTETRCADAERLEQCNETGSGWNDPVPCPPTWICDSAKKQCVEGGCTPETDFRCSSSTSIQYCNATGDGYDEPQACGVGEVCNSTRGCGASDYVCIPEAYECVDEHSIRQCNTEGNGYEPGLIPCEEGEDGSSCLDGKCVDLCERARMLDSYIGCDYWPTVLPNPQLDPIFKEGDESEFAVVVSNTNPDYTAEITINIPGKPDRVFTVTPMTDKTERLPFNELTGSAKGNAAFHLHSSIPVTVSQFNPMAYNVNKTCIEADAQGNYNNPCNSYTNDASLLLPSHVFEREYMAMTYRPMLMGLGGTFNGNMSKAFISVVASSPGTTSVTVKTTANGKVLAGGAGVPGINANAQQTYSLQQFEVLQLASDPSVVDQATCFNDSSGYQFCLGADLTGTTIESDQPVAVYSGNECQFVPHTCWACDHLEEQIFPTDSWTSQYIAAKATTPDSDNSNPNLYKIVALKDETELTTKPANILGLMPGLAGTAAQISCDRVLNAGDYCMIETEKDFIVLSKPGQEILVSQFLVGQNFDSEDVSDVGDPSMFLIPPVEQFRYDYVFLTPNTYKDDYINIMAKSNKLDIYLDDEKINNSGFKQIGGINAYVLRMKVADGTHKLTSSGRVGLIVYGYDEYVSYAYPAGLDLSFVPHK